MTFPPVAIIGRGCVLPGALDVRQFNDLLMNGRKTISEAGEKDWQANLKSILQQLGGSDTYSHAIRKGGLVRGFDEVFNPSGLLIDNQELQGDVITRWLIHAGQQALNEAGFTSLEDRPKTGMIMGNLSYPTIGHGLFSFQVLVNQQKNNINAKHLDSILRQQQVHYTDRFSTALPINTAARALGCQGESFALDAACASSLYAIKLACDRLHNHECDLMLAGAVNHSDNLVLHIGFAALGAHSLSGRSLPFQQEADGLLPGEGAAAVTLCRLEDAIQNDWPVLGIIRGIGLSNDGQRGGLLQPDSYGQTQAMKMAYQQAELDPATISYVECHATGTILGDRIELETLRHMFTDADDLPIGSLKANLGHLITVAGGAGLLKLLAAMETKTLPATPVSGKLVPELDQGPFRLITKNEHWQQMSPRRAGLNAFGFGGSNAHLILEEWCEEQWRNYSGIKVSATRQSTDEIAIVSMAVRAGSKTSTRDFEQQLFDNLPLPETLPDGRQGYPAPNFQIDLNKIKTPPSDLQDTLGQHIMVLLSAIEATDDVTLNLEKTGVYIGMGCDSEMSRHVVRWRLGYLLHTLTGENFDSDWLEMAANSLAPECRKAHILGAMPNMPACRINRLLNLQGPGFTIGAEENSGLVALHTAQLALQSGEIDTAIVGAVDLSCETIHQHAAARLLPDNRQISGDAAVVLVLRRREDARRNGDNIVALINPQLSQSKGAITLQLDQTEAGLTSRFGHAHACSGLLMMAAAARAIECGVYLQTEKYGIPWLYRKDGNRVANIVVTDIAQQQKHFSLCSAENRASGFDPDDLQLYCYAAANQSDLINCLQTGQTSEHGEIRLALVCNAIQHDIKIQAAIDALQAGRDPSGDGCFYEEQPVTGEVAFVFNGVAASYSGVSRELTLAVPQLFERLEQRCETLDAFPHVLEPGFNALNMTPLEQIFASILYGQLHTEWTQGIAAIQPHAVIGISAGETNSLFAAGAWQDLGGMFHRLQQWDVFDEALSNKFTVVDAAWREADKLKESETVSYSTWRVFHPVEDILHHIGEVEPQVRVSVIHSDQDCIIIGQQETCKTFLDKLGARAMHLGTGISIHTPDIKAYANKWHDLHHWPTENNGNIRIYSNAHHECYIPTQDAIADALTQQAITRIDFRPTVKQAYADGIRIFIEHGARNLCSNWISDILGEQPHLSIAMDVPGKNSYQQALEVIAQLWSVQVPVDLSAIHAAMPKNRYTKSAGEAKDSLADKKPAIFSMPAHMPEVQFPAIPGSNRQPQTVSMPLAPSLPLTTESWHAPVYLLKEPVDSVRQTKLPVGDLDEQNYVATTLAHQMFKEVSAMHQTYLQSISDISANMAQSLRTFQIALNQKDTQADMCPRPNLDMSVENTVTTQQQVHADDNETMATEMQALPGPKWGREELEILASDKISRVFGKLFERQDDYHRQVRMPMPPLLLADRVTGIDANPGSLGTGTIWTETDVSWSSWYLHEGHMPAGIMVESGQADLLLISYLGADFVNQDDRVYRLLGCDLTFHGALAKAGDTLKYEIHIDGHTQHGDVRLFFFHYDCYINGEHRISVRNGQAGFFTDKELDNSEGILWNPDEIEADPTAVHDKTDIVLKKQRLHEEEVRQFCNGNLQGCFGEAFALANTHTRTPSISAGQLCLLDRVTDLQHNGGPCGRGYLRAELDLRVDHWFYQGHFKNDPCMPGTLMAEGCYQAMAIYVSSLGFTLDKDGWRFEPVPNRQMAMSCRGQATPRNRKLVYEIFVTSITQSPQPVLIADILCTVDGLKAFHGKDAALQLVPGWPLEDKQLPALLDQDYRAVTVDDIQGNSHAMLACARGRPSMAFGHRISQFDHNGLRPARLPGPPYLSISRIVSMPEQAGTMLAGGEVEAELDIQADNWFFHENGAAVMPFCMLLEAALQPCGWLASFCVAGRIKHEMVFRNLDGEGTMLGEVTPEGGTLVTRIKHTRISESGNMIILSFDGTCRQGDHTVYDFNTVFGFFPPAVMAQQAGLEPHPLMAQLLEQSSTFDLLLNDYPARYFKGGCQIARGKLLMIDRISGFWNDGGSAGLGALRSEKIVDTNDWFFKAHFFQDPVQPGSLGLEAMIQLLQFYMLHTDMDKGIESARFETICNDWNMNWKYRGQVIPRNRKVEITMDITACGQDRKGSYAVANASLWVDQLRIYHVTGISTRISSMGNE